MLNRRIGFTLIELSIVLVVIGLIIGGILVGRDLIRVAALRQLGSQIESYNAAVNTFRTKYNCLPGDCNQAEQFFGTSNGSGAGPCPSSSTRPTAGTCNGDGDGQLLFTCGAPGIEEGLRVWEHLSMAGLIAGNYHTTGFESDSINGAGVTYPALPSNLAHNAMNSGIRVYWYTTPLFVPPMPTGHIFIVGLYDQCNGNSKAALTPYEAQWYDSKYDDGLPTSGNIEGAMYNGSVYGNWYSTCFTGNAYLNSDVYSYNDTVSGIGCPLFIKATF